MWDKVAHELSGGLDSSILNAIVKNLGVNSKSFSSYYGVEGDEVHKSDLVKNFLGISNKLYIMNKSIHPYFNN